jgi:hypothetical protein
MDAGSWHGPESGMPTTTFGLMTHDAIALCSWLSDGTRTEVPTAPELGFDYGGTHVAAFLSLVLEDRFGVAPKPGNRLHGYLIRKLIPLPPKSLLTATDELRIFVPDLHLHYFKGTVLDNFITWYGNRCDGVAIAPVRLERRTSLEHEYAAFVRCMTRFQKRHLKGTRVHFMGDMCEMWETEAIVRNFATPGKAAGYYEDLEDVAEWILDGLKDRAPVDPAGRRTRDAIRLLTKNRLSSTAVDAAVVNEVKALHDLGEASRFTLEPDDTPEAVREKGKHVRSRIMARHHAADGTDFAALHDELNGKFLTTGSHDNFLRPVLDGNFAFGFSKTVDPDRFRPTASNNACCWAAHHGHNMDAASNDESCGAGRLIANLLTFHEMNGRGDLVRKIEGIFRSDAEVRTTYVQDIAKVFCDWEKRESAASRNKLMVLAHTHSPWLGEITNEFRLWRGAAELFAVQPPAPAPLKRRF